MHRARWVVAAVALVAAACADDGEPATTTVSTTVSTTAPAPTTPTTAATTVPAEAVTLLVADGAGIRLWSDDGRERTVLARPAAVALPDRVGGIVYQEAETGRWEQDLGGDRVRWRWVGEGAPQPIRRLASLDAAEQTVVSPPAGASLRALDVALVEGRPTLAYLRIRHVEVPTEEVFASALADFVVRDLVSGEERVLRTQEVGWEFDDRSPALGDDLAIDVIAAYGGDYRTVEYRGLDGRVLAAPYEPPDAVAVDPASGIRNWCGPELGCELRADLAPAGPQLAYARLTGVMGAEQDPPRPLEVVVVDRRTRTELVRVAATVPSSSILAPSMDTVGGRTLVGLLTWATRADQASPVAFLQDPLLVEPDGTVRALALVADPVALSEDQTAWPSLRIWTS